MSKKSPIFYSALLLTGVNLLLRMVSTSFQVFISGQMGAAGVGLLQLVLSVGGMALTAGISGIRTATMYLTAEEIGKKRPQNVGHILSGCAVYTAVCSGTVAAGLYLAAPLIAEHWIGDLQTLPALRLLALFIPVSCLVGMMTGYFTAAGRIRTLAAVEVAEQILSMGLSLFTLRYWADGDSGRACLCVVLGSSAGSLLTLTLLCILRLREKARSGPPIPVAKRLLQTAVPLAVADDLKTGITTTENLMVPKRLALYPMAQNPLATFGTVCGMVFPVLMFPAAVLFGLCELLIPEMARCNAAGSRIRIQYLARRSLKVALLYGCFFCGILFLVATPLCNRLYSSLEAGKQLKLYALLAPMLYCDAVTDAMNKGLGQQHICVRYNILTSLMDLLGLFFLLPRWGMTGYFVSFLISHLVNFMLSLRLLLKTAQIHISVFSVFLTVLAGAAAVFLSLAVQNPVPQAVVFAVCYLCLLTLLGVIGKEDARWIKGLVGVY